MLSILAASRAFGQNTQAQVDIFTNRTTMGSPRSFAFTPFNTEGRETPYGWPVKGTSRFVWVGDWPAESMPKAQSIAR